MIHSLLWCWDFFNFILHIDWISLWFQWMSYNRTFDMWLEVVQPGLATNICWHHENEKYFYCLICIISSIVSHFVFFMCEVVPSCKNWPAPWVTTIFYLKVSCPNIGCALTQLFFKSLRLWKMLNILFQPACYSYNIGYCRL